MAKDLILLKTRAGSNGLQNMQFRINRLQGHLQYKFGPGTTVVFDVPVKKLAETEVQT